MKKSAYLILCLYLLFSPSFAMGDSTCTGETCSIQPQANNNTPTTQNTKNNDKEEADDFYNELIAPDYGSNESPDFNNTEYMNPNESNYGYEGPD